MVGRLFIDLGENTVIVLETAGASDGYEVDLLMVSEKVVLLISDLDW